MKIIVPMAGMGKRMRPHTLTIPKPLIPLAGKPIVHHLMEDIVKVCPEKVDEIAFVIGRTFGKDVESQLVKIAESLGAKGTIHYQNEPLGTAHAILSAKPALKGKVIVAFADTLFRTDANIDADSDGTIWVKQIEDPRQFGVVKVDANNRITDFVEKPQEFISDLAIIGIYYFKDGENLCSELQFLIDNNIKDKGEYQLTNAMENMKNKGKRLVPGKVIEWLDCGNKDATVYTNKRVLEIKYPGNKIAATAVSVNSVVIEPCYIDENVQLHNSIIGPHVTIGANSKIRNSVITNSIIQNNSSVETACIDNSMVGSFVQYKGKPRDLSMGDYSTEI
ncbi:MAG TPA: sugar phosphate nucleotidyltransferase [Bacteroidia bacterium]|nr:sugar phosphate nucleotidyltransferase [Bacteroidia bacterium]